MEIKKAGEIMVPLEQHPWVSHTATLKEAMAEIEKAAFNHLGRISLPRVVLVFNDEKQLAGFVRRRDIMRGLEPEFLTQKPLDYRRKLFDIEMDPNLTEISYEKIMEGIYKKAERKVTSVMLPILVTVNYDDHLAKVIYEMVAFNLSFLPVMKGEMVVGVVRTVDAFHEVANLILET